VGAKTAHLLGLPQDTLVAGEVEAVGANGAERHLAVEAAVVGQKDALASAFAKEAAHGVTPGHEGRGERWRGDRRRHRGRRCHSNPPRRCQVRPRIGVLGIKAEDGLRVLDDCRPVPARRCIVRLVEEGIDPTLNPFARHDCGHSSGTRARSVASEVTMTGGLNR
jgi:hypothetical protein